MAASSSDPIDEVQEPPLTEDWRPVRYLGSPYHGGAHFHNGVAPASVHAGSDQLTGVPVDMSSLVARIGMAPLGFEMPDGALAANSFGAVGGVPAEAAMARQQLAGGNGGKPTAPLKAPWTQEEDSMLRNMVLQHGERKWSVIAQYLPGRIGKQCRERWINHLRPDIKQNDIWTEDEDKMLIEAHRYYGNRWSAIAKHLPGRSENAVKNHWNATLRSLKAKRRLKKKKNEQAPPGQFSILEEYIRSLNPEDVVPETPPPSSSAPPPQLVANSSLVNLAVHAPAGSSAIPTNTEMSFHGDHLVAGLSNLGMINLNMPPPLPDLNTISDPQEYYLNYAAFPAPAPQLQLATNQEPQEACSSLNLSPYADYFKLLRTDLGGYYAGASSSNPGANGYYGEAGRSSAVGSDPACYTDDVAKLASREFLTPSNDEVTLDLTRFK